jgi:hypothetical protein
MRKILIALALTLVSCETKTSHQKNYKFEIRGKIRAHIRKDFHSGYGYQTIISDAIAYTDTIHGLNNDSVWYFNSNGSKVTILSPYIIKEIN